VEKPRSVVWEKEDGPRLEFAEITLLADALDAVGVAIGSEPVPYRLDYALETTASFVTARLYLTARGEGWRRTLDLRRSADGDWMAQGEAEGSLDLPAPGGYTSGLDGALDCDLQESPLTNTMPVLRHRLLEQDGSFDFVMAWVAVPSLVIHASRQRYTALRDLPEGRRLIRYEGLDSDFSAELTFDADGLVIDYPGLGRRIG
jgi:hypothetical protein